MATAPSDLIAQVHALDSDRAFVELTGWRMVSARGADAVSWLNDLVTARVDDIEASEVRRALLLDRTGHVRADVHVTTIEGGLVLIQDPVQPARIEDLLAPYVLSSDVTLEDRSEHLALFAVTDGQIAPVEGLRHSRPAERMAYALVDAQDRDRARHALAVLGEASVEAGDVWRIRRGIPRFGVDLGMTSLPAESPHFESVVDRSKGCFLGQESVARVANLGHTPKEVVAFRAAGAVRIGVPVLAEGREAGTVTSMAPEAGGTSVIARIDREAGHRSLQTSDGVDLFPN